MHAAYLVSVWIHILAATVWVGGMLFLVLVVVPWLRSGERADAAALLRETGGRFSKVAWVCFGVLLVTGGFNLWMRGVRLANFADSAWLASPFAHVLFTKLGLFVVMLCVSAWHDFVLGPRAVTAIARDARSAEARTLRRRASLIGRLNLLLALALVACGVMLVRGAF